MLAMMAAATQCLLLTFAKGQQRVYEQAKADAVLDAAVNLAVLGIGEQQLDKRWRVDGSQTDIAFDGLKIHIKVQDQLGLIDLNAADGSMITQLLQSAGLSHDDAIHLTDRILDWRSTTSLKSLSGTGDEGYAASGQHPRHGAFQSVSELQLVPGVTPTLYARIAPALTVYNDRPAFDPNLAPAPVLRALYLSTPERADAILQARSEFSSTTSPDGILANTGRAYGISASISLDGRRYRRTAVIELTGDDRDPYLILSWD